MNMTNSIFKDQTPEEFEKERKALILDRLQDLEDDSNFIPEEELSYYLEGLKRLRSERLSN